MFEAMTFLRFLALGGVAVMGLVYVGDLARGRREEDYMPEFRLAAGIALFAWLMGWLG